MRWLSAKMGYFSSPNFIIVGGQRCGTTGLSRTLRQHSLIEGGANQRKECHYFDRYDRYPTNNHSLYRSMFPLPFQLKQGTLTFDATPKYLYHPEVAGRIYNYDKSIKILIIIRNPAERFLSAWTMKRHMTEETIIKHKLAREEREFGVVVRNSMDEFSPERLYLPGLNDYLTRGIYLPQIKRYLDKFDSNQVRIIEFEELKTEFDKTIGQILHFLELTSENIKSVKAHVSKVNNRTEYEDELNQLKAFYKPFNYQLYEFLGTNYGWED